ncbi:unnamed protein product [Callosobruchus maculatus]|uniref:Uncharacterized protein n=1 Tax=Callosobruchus maculatus TaxID=64391 RepID=A0A653C995_CALMS|nr:unnamed protein product [Callosobruchus maculatus]
MFYFESVDSASDNEPFSKVKIQCRQAGKSTYLFLCSSTFEELKKILEEGGMYNIHFFIYFLLTFSLFHSMKKIMFFIATA